MPDDLLDRFRRGDRLALSRLLSRAGRGERAADLLARLGPPAKRARVIAVTGGAGVGKSTLVGKLIETIRQDGRTVAVLACDPQSPLSGGALLGDRFRMPSRPGDDGVYIRSLAAAGGRGAIADHLPALVRLLESFGFDVILIETVGAGQGDTAVHDLADAVVLLLQPETGDDIQWEKAGLLEVADVIVIHKADLPGAPAVEAQVRQALALSGGRQPAVLRVSSHAAEGLDALWQLLRDLPPRRADESVGRDLLRLAQEALAGRFERAEAAGEPALRQLVADFRAGAMDGERAAEALLRQLAAP
ncbi:MAG TPA: GTP-binding protein [Gemmataceae bacterium]|nr:GTP-binding protein [Gemmataceae bacterium]